jgi:hypothetical protein
MNPAPDMDINSLTQHYFDWAVTHMADMAIRLAKEPRPQVRELKWSTMFNGRQPPGPVPVLDPAAAEASAAARPKRTRLSTDPSAETPPS